MNDAAEFQVFEDGEFFAEVSGPRASAYAEAMHYASQCTGLVTIEELTRRVVYTHAVLTPDGQVTRTK